MPEHDIQTRPAEHLSTSAPLFPMLLALGGVFLAGLIFLTTIRLPYLFPGAGIVIGAALGGAMSLGVLMLFPARWLHSEAGLLRHAFRARHGAKADRMAMALASVLETHERARRIRHIAPSTHPDLARLLHETADRFDGIARSLFYAPDALAKLQKVLRRSDLVVEAIEAHGALRDRTKRPDSDEVVKGRRLVQNSIAALHEALDDTETRSLAQLLERVEVASDTAELLLRPRMPAP